MAAANQSAHHAHFRQHSVRQRSYHQRSFYRAAAYGCREHHADDTHGLSEAAGREIAYFPVEVIGSGCQTLYREVTCRRWMRSRQGAAGSMPRSESVERAAQAPQLNEGGALAADPVAPRSCYARG